MKNLIRTPAAVEFGKVRRFVKSLTPKERKKLKRFKKNVWWWRPGAKKHPIDFKRDNSLAFNYELVRRVKRELRLQPFPSVAGLCRFSVPALDDAPPEQIPCRATQYKAVKMKGWAPLIAEWNLNLCDAPLREAFMDFIRQARARDGIPEPRRNAGIRRTPQPWRWLELMDISDLRIHYLGDTDQTTLRKARKRAEEKWSIFSDAIEQFIKYQLENTISCEKDIGFGNEEDTGFVDFALTSPPSKTFYKLWRGVWPTKIKNK